MEMTAKHILVAEDEAHTRLSLNILLKRAGYKVTSVSDGAKALALMMKSAEGGADFVDLLMTDIQMPDMSGLELIKALKSKGIRTPVLVFTGFGDKETLIELLREGCEDYIDKPFTEDSLLERIVSALRKEEAKKREQEASSLKMQDIKRKLDSYRAAFSASCDSIESAINAYKKIIGEPVLSASIKAGMKSLSKDRLGGDFCALRDCKWGCDLILADVAGHDMGASYHTVLVKSFFDVNCRLGNSGDEFMQILNRELYKDGANERMVCAIFGRVNLDELWMETVSAAHPYFIHLGADGSERCAHPGEWKYGAPLGMFERPVLETRRFKIAPGDRLFIYSDGLPDAKRLDPESKMKVKLGEDGVKAMLKKASAEPFEQAMDSIWLDLMDYCSAKASDDMLLLGLEIPLK